MEDIEKASQRRDPLGRLQVIAFLHLLLYRLCTLFPVEEKAIPFPLLPTDPC